MTVRRSSIPEGEAGTAATIAAMRGLIERGKKDPAVRELAVRLIQKARVPPFDWLGEARAIYEGVRRNMRFTRDVRGVETLHEAGELIRLRAGDCDDFTVLLCSLLESAGMSTHIVTVAGDAEDPQAFTHVYPEVNVGGRWIPVDAARKRPSFGSAPRNVYRRKVWSGPADACGVACLNGVIPGPNPRSAPLNPKMPAALRRALSGPAPLRRNPRGIRGYGNYGQRALSRLGQDWTAGDTTQILQEIPSIEVGTSDIIAASRANPYNLVPTTNPNSAVNPANPYGTAVLGSLLSSPLLILGGLGLLAVVLLRKGR